MPELRKVEVFRDGGWQVVRMEELKQGDRFRMFDPPDFKPVVVDGVCEFTAQADAALNHDTGVFAVITGDFPIDSDQGDPETGAQ